MSSSKTALSMAMSAPWAMVPEAVENLIQIAARDNDPTPEALEAYRAERATRGEKMGVRDGVGIIPVIGPLFKRANLMTAYSGATSYEIMRRDLQAALDDPSIKAIVLDIDSPGGEANSCDEIATAIYEARGRKPVVAYVSGQACSAAYWIAAAAQEIIVSDAAILGSIGIVLGITDRKRADENAGVSRIEFVSSQSPGKRPDHETDEGKGRIQKTVDDLAAVFVSAVAQYRGVSTTTVVSNFGQGGVEIGANAVRLGMADGVGQFEAVIKRLGGGAGSSGKPLTAPSRGRIGTLAGTSDIERMVAEAKAKGEALGIAEYKARRDAIRAADGFATHPALAAELMDIDAISVEEACEMLKIASEATAAAVAAKAAYMDPMEAALRRADDRKRAAGTLGIGTPDIIGSDGGAGWGKAVASANVNRFI